MSPYSFARFSGISLIGSGAATSICVLIIDSSIKGFLLLLVAAVVCRLMIKMSAAHRHMVWTAAILGMVAMPILALTVPQWKVLPSWLQANQPAEQIAVADFVGPGMARDLPISFQPQEFPVQPGAGQSNPSNNQSADTNEEIPMDSVAPLLPTQREDLPVSVLELNAALIVSIWALGCALCAWPILISFLRLKLTESRSRPVDPLHDRDLLCQLKSVCDQLQMRTPAVLIGAADAMPMVWTLGSSRLLLPESYDQWTPSKLKSVLTHEMTHLKRRDPTFFMAALVCRALNWFNPLSWYAVRQLRIECEQACDDLVLQTGIQADEYATHLLELATNLSPCRSSSPLAFAMSSRTTVETRILSVLDENLNRRNLTTRRASLVLLFAALCVIVIASLAAHAGEPEKSGSESPSISHGSIDDEDEKATVKWPHCEVDTENLKTRSIAEEVKRFNLDSKSSPIGSQQQPVTEADVLRAVQASLGNDKVGEPIKKILRALVSTKKLTPNVYLRRFTRFDDEARFHGGWWVRLVVTTPDQGNHFCEVTSRKIYSRPYTQMERQQNRAGGTTLINRISSYYRDVPQSMQRDVLARPIKDLTRKFSKGLKDDDFDALKNLVHWTDASSATRQFVEEELDALIRANVESIQFQSRKLRGELITWSAFQRYKPNLDVIGYLVVKVAADKKHDFHGANLELELGLANGQLKLVCYVKDGDANFPKKLPKGLSITGHNALLNKGRLWLTSLVSNPGTLLSAHLANEELWLRDFSSIRNLFKYDQKLRAEKEPEKVPEKIKSNEKLLEINRGDFNVGKASPQDVAQNHGLDKAGLYSDERIVSRRLDELFEQLKVKPRLRKSSHAKDLPELYQPADSEPGRYVPRPGTLLIRYNPGIVYHNKMEHIWVRYLPAKRRYFIEHRHKLDDPHNDHVFGPYRGNPFQRLPRIEEELFGEFRSNQHVPSLVHRMLKQRDVDLAGRVLDLVDRALELEFRIPDKNRLFDSIGRLMDTDWTKLDTMGSYAEKLNSIRQRLTAFKKLVDERTMAFPDSDYSASGRDLPATIDDKLWGKPVNGLRFAVVLDSMQFQPGAKVQSTLVVENVSKENIKITVHDLVQGVRPEVNCEGKRISIESTWFSGWPPTLRFLIKPGQKVALAQSSLAAYVKEDADKKAASQFGLTRIPVTADKWKAKKKLTINYTLRIGTSEAWSRGDDDVWRVYSPGKGDWRGTLNAAAMDVELKLN